MEFWSFPIIEFLMSLYLQQLCNTMDMLLKKTLKFIERDLKIVA